MKIVSSYFSRPHILIALSLATTCLATSCLQAASQLIYPKDDAEIAFAAAELEATIAEQELSTLKVTLQIQPSDQIEESFHIQRSDKDSILITGPDSAGVMYGALDLAETLRIGGLQAVESKQISPAMGMRGIKLNIPLDVRTPSYSDLGDAGQFNIPHMWDFDFWKEYIDEMARHRYNYLSLWNLHPFPSLVKVPEYPEVALDDVKRAVNLEKKFYDGRGQNYDAPEILDETETLIEITINEKIDFWRRVMAYGKSRNVDLYFVTWNVFDYGTEGKYGINDHLDNETTKDYFRQSVKALFLNYPDLKGIGITTGENMHDASNQEKEDWMWATYGLGVMDVVKEQPERQITFLHRQHQAGAADIAKTFQPMIEHPNVEFLFSFKYAKAHAYSSTEQTFHQSFVRDLKAHGDLKTIWTMRNDSTYLFRWAAPDFLRDFVNNIPKEVNHGYYFGSDGWIWGRDYICKTGPHQGELELKRHWLQWLLWGRFAYDPELSNERIAGIVQTRFPNTDAAQLLEAWQAASMVYPLVTGFHWGPLDFHWYPEACVGVRGSRKKDGFHDIDSFIKVGTHAGTDFISIKDYVKTAKGNQQLEGTTPYELAEKLLQNANHALATIKQIEAEPNSELAETLHDIEAMALLGRYYAHKIAGSTSVHFFRETKEASHKVKAVQSLEEAAEAWQRYVENVVARYKNPQWLVRIRNSEPVDWTKMTKWVEADIETARRLEP